MIKVMAVKCPAQCQAIVIILNKILWAYCPNTDVRPRAGLVPLAPASAVTP